MNISLFIVNLFQENTYLLFDETKQAVIIDPGLYTPEDKDTFVSVVKKNNLELKGIYATHCHIDHIIGVNFLKKEFSIPFYANEKEQYNIERLEEVAELYDFYVSDKIKIDKNIKEGNEIIFGNSRLDVLETPGHTTGHLSFFSPQDNFVIAGDVIFKDTIGRTDLPGGDLDVLINSIFTKILPLGDEVIIYSGHGPHTTIGMERKDNPFL